jgi:hypothetical protein
VLSERSSTNGWQRKGEGSRCWARRHGAAGRAWLLSFLVNNLWASLSFWRDVLGFETAFERSEERFAYLEHPEGHQIMLCQRHVVSRRDLWTFPSARVPSSRSTLEASSRCYPPWEQATGRSISGHARHGVGPEIVRAGRERFLCRTRTATCSWSQRTWAGGLFWERSAHSSGSLASRHGSCDGAPD